MSETKPQADAFPTTPSVWRDVLDNALEHGSHAWAALRQQGAIELNPGYWPPRSGDEVGSAAYHVAALIRNTWEVYQGICMIYPEEDDNR